MDIKGRTWYIVGPIWTNVESHVDAVTFEGGVAHRVYITLSVNGIEDYLDNGNLVIESTSVQGFPNYNASPLAELHKQIAMEMLSTFKLSPMIF